MFQSPGGLLLILSVRSHGTQESRLRNSCEIFVLVSSGSVAALPDCPLPFLSLWKQAFSSINVNVQAPSGRPDAYKRKKHSGLLCFLVAGRRIELRTSWLWIMRSNQLSYPAMTCVKIVVEIEGLEPSLTEPESVVLPLHHISIWLPFLILGLQRYECFLKMQKYFRKNWYQVLFVVL